MKAVTETAAVDLESLVAEVADRFTEEIKQGRSPSVEEYAQRHPNIAHIIRQVFPALVLLDGSSPASSIEHPASNIDQPVCGVLGDFRILREIGRGGMGVVYEAEQISLGRRIALKVLPFAAMLDKQQLARFKNEARAAATLDHPNIVAIYSVGSERGVHYYAMQLVEGQSLAQVVQQLRNEEQGANGDKVCPPPIHGEGMGEGCPHPASSIQHPASDTAPVAHLSTLPDFDSREYYRTIARLGIQAAEALDHAHQNGILHRDIKPANLLVDDVGKLWITDFGLARIEADAGMTMAGDLLGTLRYMSPEQTQGSRVALDHRSDIYSLGATLYELVTLQPAFDATDRGALLRQINDLEPPAPRRINPAISADLETIILKTMSKDAGTRYVSAQHLADDLRRYLDFQPINARRPTPLDRAAKWSRRHQKLVHLSLLALTLLTALFAVGMAVLKRAQMQSAAALKSTSELLYSADITAALQSLEQGWSGEVNSFLGRHRPKAGEFDPRGWEWYLLNTLTELPKSFELVGHTGSVNEIAVFPDHQRLASVGDDGTLRIWDLQSQNLLKSLKLGIQPLHSVAVSPDGRFVAAGSETVYLCDVIEGFQVQEIFRSEHNIESLAFRPDGKCIAAGSRYHDVFLITLEGKLVGRAQCDSRVMSLDFLSEEHLLLLPNRTPLSDPQSAQVAQLWRDDLSAVVQEFGPASDGTAADISIARQLRRKYVLAGSAHGSNAQLISIATGRVVDSTHGTRGRLSDLAVSPDGWRFAIGYNNGIVEYYRVSSYKGVYLISPQLQVFKSQEGAISALRFVSSNQLATCGVNGSIRVWTLADSSGQALVTQGTLFRKVDLSPDGALFLYTGRHRYQIQDSVTGKIVAAKKVDTELLLGSLWSPIGDRFAVFASQAIRIVDRSGNPLFSIAFPGSPNAVAFSSDGRLFGVIGDQHLQICNAKNGEEVARQSLASPGQAVEFSHDGKHIAYGGSFDQVVLSPVSMLSDKTEFNCESDMTCIAFSPDDSILATGHRDGCLRLWEIATGKLTVLKGYEGELRDITFTPDGHTLISATGDGTVQLWSVDQARSYGIFCRTQTPFLPYEKVKDFGISLSADGRRFSIGYVNETEGTSDVRIWDIPGGSEN